MTVRKKNAVTKEHPSIVPTNQKKILEKILDITCTNQYGAFLLAYYKILVCHKPSEHLVLYKNVEQSSTIVPLLLRVHSACATSEVFFDQRCDCLWQLHSAMRKMSKWGPSMIIYNMDEEARGVGIANKLRSFAVMDMFKVNSAEAFRQLRLEVDVRDYHAAQVILDDFGVKDVCILTNNPRKVRALREANIHIHRVIPLKPKRKSIKGGLACAHLQID